MREGAQLAIGLSVAAFLATAYVLVHEKRRKLKLEKRRLNAKGGSKSGSSELGRERLLAILDELATAAYQLIEQTRKMVHVKHEQTGISLEAAVDELQKDFESAMEAVLGAVRMKHGVTEQQMTQAMAADPNDEAVNLAVTTLQEAMGGKPPPNFHQNVVEQSKRTLRRGTRRKKG